jgi:transcriptional regulator GlxA family with amidase domain
MAKFTIGVVMLPPQAFQLLDAAGAMDLIHMVTPEYLIACGLPVPKDAVTIETHWVSDSLTPLRLTAGMLVQPTTTFDTCPALDMLFIPGPPPTYEPSADVAAFLVRAANQASIVMADCSGPMVLAQAGLLDGKRATINKEIIPLVKAKFPKVDWRADERWVVDGKLWTAGGAMAG